MTTEQTFINHLGFEARLRFEVVELDDDLFTYDVYFTGGSVHRRVNVPGADGEFHAGWPTREGAEQAVAGYIGVCKSNIRQRKVRYLPAQETFIDDDAGMRCVKNYDILTKGARENQINLPF